MRNYHFRSALALAALFGLSASSQPAQAAPGNYFLQFLMTDGRMVEGRVYGEAVRAKVNGKDRVVLWKDVLSIHRGAPATETESSLIAKSLAAVQGMDRAARDEGVASLVKVGIPALTPLLTGYKDTTTAEPNPLYRLLTRIAPIGGDTVDRTLDIVRMDNGEIIRGIVDKPDEMKVTQSDGKKITVKLVDVRRIGVLRDKVSRDVSLDSYRHCSQIEDMDTGVSLTDKSHLEMVATGIVRLSFNEDFWIANPDGLVQPKLTGQKREVNGQKFGALLGKVGPTGQRWFAGRHAEKLNLGVGRLYLCVNDNDHWQNNIGAYRVRMEVTLAFDYGEAE